MKHHSNEIKLSESFHRCSPFYHQIHPFVEYHPLLSPRYMILCRPPIDDAKVQRFWETTKYFLYYLQESLYRLKECLYGSFPIKEQLWLRREEGDFGGDDELIPERQSQLSQISVSFSRGITLYFLRNYPTDTFLNIIIIYILYLYLLLYIIYIILYLIREKYIQIWQIRKIPLPKKLTEN